MLTVKVAWSNKPVKVRLCKIFPGRYDGECPDCGARLQSFELAADECPNCGPETRAAIEAGSVSYG